MDFLKKGDLLVVIEQEENGNVRERLFNPFRDLQGKFFIDSHHDDHQVEMLGVHVLDGFFQLRNTRYPGQRCEVQLGIFIHHVLGEPSFLFNAVSIVEV